MNTIALILLGLILTVASALVALLVLAREVTVKHTRIEDHGGNTLLVLLHAYTAKGDTLKSVETTLRQIPGLTNASVLTPDLPLGLFSMARPGNVLAQVLGAVDRAWDERQTAGKPYDHIILVGHSVGALYARK